MRTRRRTEISILTVSMLDVISAALAAVLILFIVTLRRAEQMQQEMVPISDLRAVEQQLTESERVASDWQGRARHAENSALMASNRAERAELAAARAAQRAPPLAAHARPAAEAMRAAEVDVQLRILLADAARAQAESARDQAQQDALLAEQHAAEAEQLAAVATSRTATLEAQLSEADRQLAGAVSCQVATEEVTLSFFDNDRPDGDVVDVFLNGEVIEDDLELPARAHPYDRPITLEPGLNHLRILAVEQGADGEVNTAEVRIGPCNNERADNFDWDLVNGAERNLVLLFREQ